MWPDACPKWRDPEKIGDLKPQLQRISFEKLVQRRSCCSSLSCHAMPCYLVGCWEAQPASGQAFLQVALVKHHLMQATDDTGQCRGQKPSTSCQCGREGDHPCSPMMHLRDPSLNVAGKDLRGRSNHQGSLREIPLDPEKKKEGKDSRASLSPTSPNLVRCVFFSQNRHPDVFREEPSRMNDEAVVPGC
jgi:hypothetical protein